MRYAFDDGGRADSGFKGRAGDCGVRAISIALDVPYRATYNALKVLTVEMTGGLERSVRSGVFPPVFHKYLIDNGWSLVLTPGQYLIDRRFTYEANFIACIPRHWSAIVRNTVRDTWDSRKSNRTKCGAPRLLGFYQQV